MKTTKKTWIIFRNIMLFLFVLYLISYFQVESGNYININTKKTLLTEEQIKEFEKDVKEGKMVDIKNYTEETYIDSNNKVSDIGYIIGENISEFATNKIGGFIEFLSKYVS